MLLSRVKNSIKKGMERSYKIPENDELSETVFQALMWVATQCEPSELIRDRAAESDETVLRYLPDMKFIVVPEYPDFNSTEKHLMIDEALVFAVTNFTCFILSGEAKFKALSDEWVATYRRNDILGFLGDEVNDDE